MNHPTSKKFFQRLLVAGFSAVALGFVLLPGAHAADFDLSVEQITFGEKHHFFGYTGQCRTIPWPGTRTRPPPASWHLAIAFFIASVQSVFPSALAPNCVMSKSRSGNSGVFTFFRIPGSCSQPLSGAFVATKAERDRTQTRMRDHNRFTLLFICRDLL